MRMVLKAHIDTRKANEANQDGTPVMTREDLQRGLQQAHG